jgi:flagellar protein FliO/FliZ
MGWYLLKLLIMIPIVGGMAFGALWLWRRLQPGLLAGQANRSLKLLEAMPMGTFGKLAVIEFEGEKLLIAVTRGRIERIAGGVETITKLRNNDDA